LDLVQAGIQKQQIAKLLNIHNATVTNLLSTRKRILVIGDTHCGHVAGLTPQKWHNRVPYKFLQQAEEKWDWFNNEVKSLKPDICFILGDIIDGKNRRTGGSELITQTWQGQLEIAAEIIETIGANTNIAVFGTPYHVGDDDDFENFLTRILPNQHLKIGGHEFPKVHNIQFDLKHKIGSSTIPHGRFTPLAKSKLWNQVWKDIDGQPKADVIIRGHTHYFDYCGDNTFLAIICPALQGWGSKYGIRQCEGIINTGILWFDIYDGTNLSNLFWRWNIPVLESHKIEVMQL